MIQTAIRYGSRTRYQTDTWFVKGMAGWSQACLPGGQGPMTAAETISAALFLSGTIGIVGWMVSRLGNAYSRPNANGKRPSHAHRHCSCSSWPWRCTAGLTDYEPR